MQIKKGIPVSPGVAIAPAVVLDAVDQPIPRRSVPAAQVKTETERLERALAAAAQDVEQDRERATAALGPDLAKIFSAHLYMLQDPVITGEMRQIIARERVTAEYAVYAVMREWVRRFQSLESKHFRDRDADLWDLEHRIIGHLVGSTRSDLAQLRHESVLVAHDLTPSQTAALDKTKVRGIATDLGGRTSHTAIMAHALSIPAVVGVDGLSTEVASGATVIIDGHEGLVIIDPDASRLMEYRERLARRERATITLDEQATLAAVTTDGTEVAIYANIEFPSEIVTALQKGAAGIGLYRTEFLFLTTNAEPTEEQQYEAYREAISLLGGKVLTIRTFDLGADKVPFDGQSGGGNLMADHLERNPFLGCRSIRMCLQNLPLFKRQLRAILRASAEGPVRIMFPLISSVPELRQAKMMLHDVREDLDEEAVPCGQDLPVGIMIEVPSAALQAKALARECEFFSIGTNDLIQYTVAVDRGNERIASLYSAAHPAVIQLVKDVVRAAHRAKIEVSLCGEMAGEPEYVMLLLGLGLRALSITPPAVPQVKRVIRSVSIHQCQRLARRVSAMDSDREVLNYLREEVRKLIPEVFDGRSVEA